MPKKTFVRPIAQAVHRRSITSEKWIKSQGSLRGTCGGQCSTGKAFSLSEPPPPPVSIIPTIFQARTLVTDAV